MGAMKDKTSIGIALVVTSSSSFTDLEIAVIRATCHDHNPPHESCIRHILYLTTYSRPMVRACITITGRRLNRTNNWVVALKSLILLHRLLNDGDYNYQHEIHHAKRRGSRFLSMAAFRGASSDDVDYCTFVRPYALYLDEKLQFTMQTQEKEDSFSRAYHLSLLLNRFLACRPTGRAKYNRVVDVALYLVVKESFKIFHDTTEVMAHLIEQFMKLEIPDMVQVHEIFCQASRQYNELDDFYDWCKRVGIMRPSKFPEIHKIPEDKLEMMDDFICQKSQLLEPITTNPEEDKEEKQALPPPEEVHLLDLRKGEQPPQELLALTLFQDTPTLPLELVESSSHLYQQGSASAQVPPMMDPFAASAAIAPPAYVQISDMEKQQRLLMEEQMLWQHGIRGQLGLGNVVHQQYPYHYVAGGTARIW